MDLSTIYSGINSRELIISVFGLGRIGLPTALMFTRAKYHVIGVDIDEALLIDLRNKNTFIDEPGLVDLLEDAIENNLIEFTSDFSHAITHSNIMIICVPTPVSENKVPDYRAIKDVTQKIGNQLFQGQIVICESSISPTTIRDLIIPILEENSRLQLNVNFGVCSCPERADPGKIIANFDKVTRIVGGSSQEIGEAIVTLYKSITNADIIQLSTPGTANAVKLTENIFRDVNIALINELAVLYEKLGIDVKEVIRGASTKYNFQPHYPGPGVGGPCLPANPYYIIQDADKMDYIPFLIRVAREVNDRMPAYTLDLITDALNYVGKSIKDTKITVLGLSYKANVRDIQISPSIKVAKMLKEKNAIITIWDPYYMGESLEELQIAETSQEVFKETDCIVLLTDHKEFKDIHFEEILNNRDNENPLVFVDSRNVYDPENLPKGIVYCGVGRKIKET
ncbi:MAG: Nucleotide sugar dehydrogenase [Promethearchaeota archaeon]|nr:MAG: Nucleotide sugar dehydrogenase [Candidatus Lokiarchaeota archaeon]